MASNLFQLFTPAELAALSLEQQEILSAAALNELQSPEVRELVRSKLDQLLPELSAAKGDARDGTTETKKKDKG